MKYITFYYILYFFVFVSANNSKGIFKLICSKCSGTCCIGTAIKSNFIITTKYCAESCQYVDINNKRVAISKTHVYPHNFPYRYIGGSTDSIALIELDNNVADVSWHVIAIPPESAFGLEAEVIRFDNEISKSLALVKHCEKDFKYYDGYFVCTTKAFRTLQMGAPLLFRNRIYGVLGHGYSDTHDHTFMAIAPAIDWIQYSINPPSSPVEGKKQNVIAKETKTISSDIPKQENRTTSAPKKEGESDDGPAKKEDETETTYLPEYEYETDTVTQQTDEELDTGFNETINVPGTDLPETATDYDIGSRETKKEPDTSPSKSKAESGTDSPETRTEPDPGIPKTENGLDTLEMKNESDTGPPETEKEPETQIEPETSTTLVTVPSETKLETNASLSETGEITDDVAGETEKDPDDGTKKTENDLDTGTPGSKVEPADLTETINEKDYSTPKIDKQDFESPETENKSDILSMENTEPPEITSLDIENEPKTGITETWTEPDTTRLEKENEFDTGPTETREKPDGTSLGIENEPETGTPETRKETDTIGQETENEYDKGSTETGEEPDATRLETDNEPDTGTPATEKELGQDKFENNARYGPSRVGKTRYSPLLYGRQGTGLSPPTKLAKNSVPGSYLHGRKKQNKESLTTNVMDWFNKYAGDLREKKRTFVLTTAVPRVYFGDLT